MSSTNPVDACALCLEQCPMFLSITFQRNRFCTVAHIGETLFLLPINIPTRKERTGATIISSSSGTPCMLPNMEMRNEWRSGAASGMRRYAQVWQSEARIHPTAWANHCGLVSRALAGRARLADVSPRHVALCADVQNTPRQREYPQELCLQRKSS